jgi:hypothetical protein
MGTFDYAGAAKGGALTVRGHPAHAGTRTDVAAARVAAREARRGSVVVFLGVFAVVETLLLELWAMQTNYGLRVIADTPTYFSVLRELALRPFQSPHSPFVVSGNVNLAHATPDMQLLAFIWKLLAAKGAVHSILIDYRAAYVLLAIKGAVVTLLVFHALFVWVRREAGSRAAWIAIAVLPLIWGPALIVSPGDLSFHGFMVASDHSESLAIALGLYALVVVDARLGAGRLLGAGTILAAVMVTHPFTGVRLAAILTAYACYKAVRGDESWQLVSPTIVLGFLMASLWPAYHLSDAMQVGALKGWQLVLLLVAMPFVAIGAKRVVHRRRSSMRLRVPALDGPHAMLAFAVLGLAVIGFVVAREVWLYGHPDTFFTTNRRAIYWNGISIVYWPLLLAPAAIGFSGLARLARGARPLAGLWAGGCLAVGVCGALGLPIPLSHRFLLFAQIPMTLGVAVVLTERKWRLSHRLGATALAGSTLLSLGMLVFMPQNVTYFQNDLQAGWSLTRFLPDGAGVTIASDPVSEYFVLPTGNHIVTLTTWHIGSKSELVPARRGYLLMHSLYMDLNWRPAAERLWRLGARYIVANRGVSMRAPTLDNFSSFNAPYIVSNWNEQAVVDHYIKRLGVFSTLIGRDREYYVFKLDRKKLFGA